MILPLCVISGFVDVETVDQSGTLGVALENMQHTLAYAIAWVALVGSPAIAALTTGCMVLSHRRDTLRRRAGAADA